MNVAVENTDRLNFSKPLLGDSAPVATGKTPPALFPGPGVTVTEVTDFQRLMDELKMAQEEERQKLTVRQFAIALQQLTAQNLHLTEAQTAAIEKVEEATTALEAAKRVAESAAQEVAEKGEAVIEAQKTVDVLMAELAKQSLSVVDLEKNLAALKATLDGKSTVLDVMIKNLNELVEAQKKSREEREKEIRAKEQKAEEEATEVKEESAATKEDEELQRQIDDLSAQITALRTEIAGLQSQADTLSGQISAGKEAISAQKTAVSAAQGALKKAQDELTAAQTASALAKGVVEASEANIQAALTALDKVSLAAVAAALDAAVVKILKLPDENVDDDKAEKKTEAIKKLAEDLSRAIEEKNDEDLEKLVAKLPDALDWFARHTVTDPLNADLPDSCIPA